LKIFEHLSYCLNLKTKQENENEKEEDLSCNLSLTKMQIKLSDYFVSNFDSNNSYSLNSNLSLTSKLQEELDKISTITGLALQIQWFCYCKDDDICDMNLCTNYISISFPF
jgi:uncharacterized protein YjfI (DUF2170 family)